MVEKAGHKKKLMTARNEWISEGKPTAAGDEDDERDVEQQASTSETNHRPATPPQPTTQRSGVENEDLYDATPRRERATEPIGREGPDPDDLDALIAEAEADSATTTGLSRRPPPELDDDDLDALIAEAEADTAPNMRPSRPPPPELDDEELDALMAEAEQEDASRP